MADTEPATFEYEDGSVAPGESEFFRFEVTDAHLSEPIRVPVTVINGDRPGPTAFLSAGVHGNELNGVEVVRHVADEFDHDDLRGTLVCLHVVNVPGFTAQERYVPIDDEDLNRSFPGSETGKTSSRIAHAVYNEFVEPCDFGIDFHSSTPDRTNLIHARGDMDDPTVSRLARAFGTNVVLDGEGAADSLRRVATEDGVPTITVEMGEGNRFQREVIDDAVGYVRNVFAEFDLYPDEEPREPEWRVVAGSDEKEWVRAGSGGLVERHANAGDLLREGDRLCTIRNPFDKTRSEVEAPRAGVVVGVRENAVVHPGGAICHFVEVPESTYREAEGDGGA